jgi:MEDS: MEthanogen/methylotroph, DcmR Sensory domain
MPITSPHAVHIYAESNDLIVHLSGIVASSLVVGDAVVIIAKEAHQQQLLAELNGVGMEVERYLAEGLLTMWGAQETLASFMVNGVPEPSRFRAAVTKILEKARERSSSKSKSLTVFGEMVALLWEEGNHAGALRLEELWNGALKEMPFRLHCGYSKHFFKQAEELQEVCRLHSSVLRIGESTIVPSTFAAD